MDFVLVYMTMKNKEEAGTIGRTLVEERLAGCVNIIDNVTSIYRWNGEICADNETVMLAKTSADKFDALSERVRQIHSYECSCIVSLPLSDGSGDYLNWLTEGLS